MSGYEEAGRSAAERPGTTAIVVVHDLRQALAWLCGRTNNTITCAAAGTAAWIPIGTPPTTSTTGYSHDHDSHHD